MEKEITKLLEKANYAVDKVIEHSPRIIEDYIQYKTTMYIIEPLLLLLILLSIVFISRQFGEKDYDWVNNDTNFFGRYFGMGGIFLYMGFGLFFLFFIVSLFCSTHGLILINTSKEIFIIQQFTK